MIECEGEPLSFFLAAFREAMTESLRKRSSLTSRYSHQKARALESFFEEHAFLTMSLRQLLEKQSYRGLVS